MHTQNRMAVALPALTISLVLAMVALVGCAPKASTTTSSAGSNSTADTNITVATTDVLGDVATKADIDKYCGDCHFQNVDNDAISSFNKSNIDVAMVHSMVPLSDHDANAIAAYFSTIEPKAQTGGAQ